MLEFYTANQFLRRRFSVIPAILFGLVLAAPLIAQEITFDAASSSGLESVTSVNIPVTASGYGAFPVTVELSVVVGTTTASGSDYSVTEGILTFSSNSTQNVNLTIVSDALYEANEVVVLGLAFPSAGIINPNSQHTYTIQDDDVAPTIYFTSASGSGSEGTSPGNLEVRLSAVSGLNASINYQDAGTGTASPNGVDYSLASGTVTITAGQTTANIPVTIINDVISEFNETVVVNLLNATAVNSTLANPATHTYTIVDNDDNPKIQFTNATSGNSEAVSPATIQIELDAISGKNITVNYSVSGTATGSGTDHNLASGTATINAGNLTTDLSINITNDALDEYDETIIITLSSPTNASLGTTTTHTYTIVDEDPTPAIDFSSSSSSGSEGTTPATIQVRLSAPAGRNASVIYAVTGGTATSGGVDFTLASGTATITAGNTTTNISVNINNDGLDETNETFIVTLSSPTNASLGINQTHTYTIIDNDDPPTIAFSDTISSGSEGTITANLQVRLSTLSGLNATVNYSVAGTGTATGGGVDYTLTAGTATITAGTQTTNISITINDDELDEPSETVVVVLADPTNASLGGNTSHTRTIIDNDSPPSVEFATGTSSGNEGSTSPSFSLALTAVSGFTITVDYAASGLSATKGVDFTMPNGTATIPAGQSSTTISATIIDDAIDEFNESFVVSLSNPTNSSVGTTNPTHTYTITDNDVTPTIGFTGVSGSGLEEVTPVQPIIEISAVSGKNISINYAVTGTALGGGIDYSLTAGTASILAGEIDTTLTISVIDDAIYENTETIIVSLFNPVNTTLDTSKDTYTYSIQNNDAAPVIEFDLATSSGGEGTTPVSIQITLSEASAVDALVNYAVTGGTASGSGVDFTMAPGTATIDSAQTSVNITAVIIEDQFDEPNETIIITLSNPLNATLGAQTTHTYTITDNDDPPTVAFVTQGSSGNESTANVNIPVNLSAASQRTITVNYAVTAGNPAATGNGIDYTLADGQLTFTAGTTSVNITATIVDNQVVEEDEAFVVTLSGPVNSNLGTLTTHTYTILNDDSPPVDFTVDSVYATGGTKVEDYWNASNTSLTIKVPVDTSSTLVNGSIQLEAKIGGGTYENLGAAYTITGGDLGQNKVLNRTAAQVEALTNFGNDSTLTIRAIMDDAVGNSTTGSPSSNIIAIDQAPPAAFTTGSALTTGGTVVTGYWNASNTGLRITVPLDNTDNSLSGGSIQLRGEADGTFEDLGNSVTITQTDVTSQAKNLTVSASEAAAAGVEELAGLSEGDILTFRSVITDIAGNTTTGALSASSLIVDQTVPTAEIAYSDTLVSQGDTVTFTMTMDEAATATPKISIAYSLNTVPATNMTASIDPAVWTYNAVIPAANDGLATVTITGKDLAGNSLTTGNTSSRTKLLVDNTPPGYVLSYTDSLVKAADTFTITATVEEPVRPTPTITINYAGSGADVTDTIMSMGASDSIWTFLATAPTGNDGFATVTISALDIAGNTVTPISGSTNTLKVDNIPPTLSLTTPTDNAFVRTTSVSYSLGEALANGQMVWTWESNSGVTDNNSPHTQTLTGSELLAGSFSGLLTNEPTLAQAAEYTVSLIGVDRAGNADTVEASTITYDTLAPAISAVEIHDGPTADIDSTRSTDTLTVHYSGFNEPTSAIVLYEYALGSSAGDNDLVAWTGVGTDTLVTVRGLHLDYKDSYFFMIRATDGAGNQSDSVVSDGIRVVDKPRLTIHAVQNIVFPDYVQVLVNDTLSMADSVSILIDSVRVAVDAVDTYSYIGTHKFTQAGTHSLQVTGYSGWGDTLRTASLSMSLAKTWSTWSAISSDGILRVSGAQGAVNEDRPLLLVGSDLLEMPPGTERAYRLADGKLPFAKPVKVSMRSENPSEISGSAQAIYVLRPGGQWEELPSVDEQGTVAAWTNRSGTFKLGLRTIVVPVETALHQNYPNPFNPATTIVFDIGLRQGPSQDAKVVIYNLLGQQVKTLFDGPAPAGRYSLTWSGLDELGSPVATGIYFVRLLTEQGTQKIRKMLLIR